MAWNGVITDAGSALLNRWDESKTLSITKAAAGTGRAATEELRGLTALTDQRQDMSIVSKAKDERGYNKIKLHIGPPEAGYQMTQYGIWAALDGEDETLLAVFQNSGQVDIPSSSETPDFAYSVYSTLTFDNTGNLTVNIDTSANVTLGTMQEYIDEAETRLSEQIKKTYNKKADLGEDGKVPVTELPDLDFIPTKEKGAENGVAELDAAGKVPTEQLPTVPVTKGGTGATDASAAVANLISALEALTSSGLATTDLVGVDDVSEGTGKKVTLQNLATYLAGIGGAAKIQTGSYVGTGTYGADNPCKLTFDFIPKLLFLYSYNGEINPDSISYALVPILWGKTNLVQVGSANEAYRIHLSYNGATISFYNGESYYSQYNNAGSTYPYLVLA